MANHSPQQTFNQYKLRVLARNHSGEVFIITIPTPIGTKHNGDKFTIREYNTTKPIEFSGNFIVLQSGLDLAIFRREVSHYDIEQYQT